MRRENKQKLFEGIKGISRMFIEEVYPEELEYFDIFWEPVSKIIDQWSETERIPDKWPFDASGTFLNNISLHF